MRTPPRPPEVSYCTWVMAPLTRIWAGVSWPVTGVFRPWAVRPEAPRSCSSMAAPRMSVSPRTMNRPVWFNMSVITVPQASPMSHWPRQPAWFSNLGHRYGIAQTPLGRRGHGQQEGQEDGRNEELRDGAHHFLLSGFRV